MIIRGAAGLLHKVGFQVRYRLGYTYLDRCGRLINKILADAPEWILAPSAPSPQGAPLISLRNGAHFSFSSTSYDFSLEQTAGDTELREPDVTTFAEQVNVNARLVQDQLALTLFSRIGFQVFYFFPNESREAAERWISELGPFGVRDSIASAFTGTVDAQAHTVVVKASDRSYRVSINVVERSLQVDLGESILAVRSSGLPENQRHILLEQERVRKRVRANPQFAVMIDVDAYLENPGEEIDPKDFIQQSWLSISTNLPHCFG